MKRSEGWAEASVIRTAAECSASDSERASGTEAVQPVGGVPARELWLDVLKVLSAPLIVLIHTVGSGYSSAPLGSGTWLGYLVLNTLPRCAVPIFIMVSGALLLGREVSIEKAWRKAKKAIVLLVVWNLVYICAQAVLWGPSEPIWKQILSLPVKRGPSGHLWYAHFLVGLYLFAPVVSALYQTLSERGRVYFVLLSVAVPGVLDLYVKLMGISTSAPLPSFSLYMALAYMGIMFIGRMIRENADAWPGMRRFSVLAAAAGFVGMLTVTFFYCRAHGSATDMFMPETQLFAVCYGAGVVGFAASFHRASDNWPAMARRVIEEVSKLSIGIYFIHQLFIWTVKGIDIGAHHIRRADRPIEALILTGVYYLLALLASWLLSKLPGLRVLVTMEGRAAVKRGDQDDAAPTGEKKRVSLPRRKRALILLAAAALAYAALRFVPVGDRTITITALNKRSDIGQGSEIWIKSVTVDGEECAPWEVFSEGWIEEEGYLKWRAYDQPEGTTNTITATFPAGTDVDIQFQTNQWRGIAGVKDGSTVIPSSYRVDCWSDSKAQDQTMSYLAKRMAPGSIRTLRVVLVYAAVWAACYWLWRATRKKKS